MNQPQKKLLAIWFPPLLFLLLVIVNGIWELESWDWLQLPLFAVSEYQCFKWLGREMDDCE
jgi:hypothetical protein